MSEAELLKTLTSLSEDIRALRISVQELAARTSRSEWLIRMVAGVAVLGLLLTLFVSGLYLNQRSTDRRLDAAIQQQDVIRARVLCPLYALFVGSYDPKSPNARANRARYEAAFAEIRKQMGALGCPTAGKP